MGKFSILSSVTTHVFSIESDGYITKGFARVDAKTGEVMEVEASCYMMSSEGTITELVGKFNGRPVDGAIHYKTECVTRNGLTTLRDVMDEIEDEFTKKS